MTCCTSLVAASGQDLRVRRGAPLGRRRRAPPRLARDDLRARGRVDRRAPTAPWGRGLRRDS
eukprot:1194487-Alexandrium_andersonii.AAC.1